jgi:hypothetical protein
LETTMAYTRREADQCDVIRKAQREVEDACEAVSRGEPGAVARYNRAIRDEGASQYGLYRIAAGYARKDR